MEPAPCRTALPCARHQLEPGPGREAEIGEPARARKVDKVDGSNARVRR